MEENKNENLIKRDQIDNLNLQYQTLLYEKANICKEIDSNKEYISKEKNIELIPLEEFMKKVHPSFLNYNSDHQLKLNQLEWELYSRKESINKLKELESKKLNLQDLLINKTNQLKDVSNQVKSITKSAEPLANALSISKFWGNPKATLTGPLFALYNAALTYVDARGSIAVTIDGQPKIKIIEEKKEEVWFNSEEPLVKAVDPFEADPQTVTIKFLDQIDEFSLQFKFYIYLNLVSVYVASPSIKAENWLSHLITPNDTGIALPVGKHDIEFPNAASSFDYKVHGFIYSWVQPLSGVYLSRENVQLFTNVMTKILDRLKSRRSLSMQAYKLEKKQFGFDTSKALFRPSSTFNLSRVKDDDLQHQFNKFKDIIIDHGSEYFKIVVSTNKKRYDIDGLIKITMRYPDAKPIFYLKFSKSQQSSLFNVQPNLNIDSAALEQATSNLVTDNDFALLDLQEELNLYGESAYIDVIGNIDPTEVIDKNMVVENSKTLLSLSFLVYKLLICVDIFAESESKDGSGSGVKFERSVKGRDRKRPFSFDRSRGMYSQRP